MSVFFYKARTQQGEAIEGKLDASTAEEAAKKLRTEGFMPTQISEQIRKENRGSAQGRSIRIKSNDMIMFNNQLANLIGAGIPLLTSLRTIGKVVEARKLKDIIDALSHRIAGGSSFSEALAEHGKTFPPLFINMVKAGETGGQLNRILQRYAVYLEQQDEIRQKIQNALMYPLILLIFGIAVIMYILSTVIPKFVDIFVKAGVELPWPTQVLYNTGLTLKNHWVELGCGLLVVVVGIMAIGRTGGGTKFFDTLELKMPILGPLSRKIYLSRFSRSLATLLESGVSVLVALDIIESIIKNSVLRTAIEEARRRVEQGDPLSKPLEKSGQFPADIIQMIAVGEESGELSKMLHKTADFYDSYTDHAIKRLLVLIEPILIILMAVMVGIIMTSVILPLFDMIKTIK